MNNTKQPDHNALAFDRAHRKSLIREIGELKSRVRDHDTGHIRTAIGVLTNRVKEIDRLRSKQTSWEDPLLLGIYDV